MSEHPPKSSSKWLIVSVIALLAISAVVAFFALSAGKRPVPPRPEDGQAADRPQEPDVTAKSLSLAEKKDLLKLSHVAIGHLENERWREALNALNQIDAVLPGEPFVARNAGVALAKGAQPADQASPGGITVAEADAGIERLKRVAPADPISNVLIGHIENKLGRTEQAIASFEKATEIDPQSVVAWYALYESLPRGGATGDNESSAVDERRKTVLLTLQKLLPDNLRIAHDLLITMIETRDRSLPEQLARLKPRVPQITGAAREILGRISFEEVYQKAVADAERVKTAQTPAEWSSATASTQRMKNALVSLDLVYSDLMRLKPNELDFMVFRFSDPQLATTEIEPESLHPAIPVKYSPMSLDGADPFAELSQVLHVQVADFDLDQSPDLWVLTPGKLTVIGRQAGGSDWTTLTVLNIPEGFERFLAADLDWDTQAVTAPGSPVVPEGTAPAGNGTTVCHQSDADLMVYGPAGIRVWKNDGAQDGGRGFVPVEQSGLESVTAVTAALAADVDHDGDLDLLLGSATGLTIWSNRENFGFKEISDQSTLPQGFAIQQLLPVDWDRDVDLDVIVVGHDQTATSVGLLMNHLHGALTWKSFEELQLSGFPKAAHCGAIVDADRNASWDLLWSDEQGLHLGLTRTIAAGQVTSLEVVRVSEIVATGLLTLDYDNDGYLDLLAWNQDGMHLWRGTQAGKYLPANDVLASQPQIRSGLASDLDQDGDLDLVVTSPERLQLLTNDGGNKNHWLTVRLRALPKRNERPAPGMQNKRVNHQGYGSLVELQTGGLYVPQVAVAESLHFGLGQHDRAELLRVLWTNGVPQGLLDVRGNWEVCEEQLPKGSCPFAYTWDGEKFTFYTDLLWNAPLGLQFAEGVVAPARQWEYLKVDGQRMVPKDGKYVLQVTEELWEATYFDQIELLAVDHPADVDIYSNEKVGPASISEFKIHTVREPRPVSAARDQRGRDVLEDVVAADGVYTRGYDQVLRQGLTTPHWLELDLGAFEANGPITLFLTGWMYPTETSISVGVSQNPSNEQARPPALWIPDTAGEWQEVRPFMGFPGGKTKTIAIDLTDAFPGQDHCLRIATNMQFHWDHAFYSVGESPAEVALQPMTLTTADLHYRGVSQHYWLPGNGPDQYDYNSVLTSPQWPPMKGRFTRYGDVRELLTATDDRLVVVGAGDEITLTFDLPEKELPAGWKRDFILHNVGWDKDADLNTLTGQTVEPLPYNAMTGYPYPLEEGPPDTAEYRAYLLKYQTRLQSFGRFWSPDQLSKPSRPTASPHEAVRE